MNGYACQFFQRVRYINVRRSTSGRRDWSGTIRTRQTAETRDEQGTPSESETRPGKMGARAVTSTTAVAAET